MTRSTLLSVLMASSASAVLLGVSALMLVSLQAAIGA